MRTAAAASASSAGETSMEGDRGAEMDGGLDNGDEWDDAAFVAEIMHVMDEEEAARAARNPNLTPTTPAPAPATVPTHDPIAATKPVSFLPAASASNLPSSSAPSASNLPAASHSSPPRSFSPPPELSERPPLPPPTAAATSARDAPATRARDGGDFSPPHSLSQRSVAEGGGSLAMVPASGSAGDHPFVGTGGGSGGAGAKRDREARELDRLKRELSRVSKQMNQLKNECAELRKDGIKKDLQIKVKEAEIQNLKKANVSSCKDVCSTGMGIDQSFHAPANGALHAGGSSRTFTRRADKMNGKDKDVYSLRDDLYIKQEQQTDLPEALEVRRRTIIDNGINTSGVVSLEENTHVEPRSTTCKEIKAIGVQTDNTSDNEHLERKKVLVERISSDLHAMWGMSPNSLSIRNLISKINVSCSEEILSLVQYTRLSENCEPSSGASSSLGEAISQVYDMFIKMNNGKISIQTFLQALLNLCAFDNAAIAGRALRVLLRVLQHLLHHGAKSSESVPSGTMFLLNHMLTYTWRATTKTVLPC